ncbi:MAG: glycine betaine/L-proline ABC transporter substrate-binding protein ProX [Leptolyngbya sp. SIO4C1]|nr:glycine betaine/L-proline ABC transporter substrate-binding protein ProX [Leptolyngbya sp. SIO4C1]
MLFNHKRLSIAAVGLLLLGLAGCRTQGLMAAKRDSTVIRSAYGTLEELFQTEIVNIGLEELGYRPISGSELEYDVIHKAIAEDYLDYTAVHWNPLHSQFYENNGGNRRLERVGPLVENALQGYLIDRETAEQYDITNLNQLANPEIARLFDNDGDGRANLIGCPPGWGCRDVIEYHLDTYGLRKTVEHDDDNYFTQIEAAIAQQEQGQPILYYTWTPLWVSGVLTPNEAVTWLEVPYTALPEGQDGKTISGGKNLGFSVNQIEILANDAFLEANPAAKRWFELVKIPIKDISLQNQRMHDGENTPQNVRRHAEKWVKDNRGTFDSWLAEAKKAQ